MRRHCPLCNRRVQVYPEKETPNATLPDAVIVWAYADHGCDNDGMPVERPAKAPAPPEPAPPRCTKPGERQRWVYNALAKGPATAAELARLTDATEGPTRHALARLEAAGRVTRQPSERGTLYTRVPLRAQILALLAKGPRTEPQIRTELNRSRGATHHHLTRLEEEGRVVRTGRYPALWEVAA